MVLKKKKIRQLNRHVEEEELPLNNQKSLPDVKFTDEQLFSTNVGTDGLRTKRDKLKANRFKEIEHAKNSKTERILVKRLATTMDRRIAAGQDAVAQKKKPATEDEMFGGELEDLWSTPQENTRRMTTYKNKFAKVDHVNVKAVMMPKGGHSYNPTLKAHSEVLKDAAKAEEEIVEKKVKEIKHIKPSQFLDQKESESEEKSNESEGSDSDESSGEDGIEKPISTNKPVDRLDNKTQAQRNKDVLTRAKEQRIKDMKERRQFERDLDRLENLVKQTDNTTKQQKRRIERKRKAEEEEQTAQETVGVVTKPKNIGRFKYAQRKVDYQLEDQLSGSFRQIQPLGNDNLLLDRFDSIYRRNLVEMDAPSQNMKRRQRKQKYKMISKLGPKAVVLARENEEMRKRNDAKEKGFKKIANDDLIMI